MNATTTWAIYRTRFLVKAKQLEADLTFTDNFGRKHSGVKGDYLVEAKDGNRRITPRHLFEDIYVLFSEGEREGASVRSDTLATDWQSMTADSRVMPSMTVNIPMPPGAIPPTSAQAQNVPAQGPADETENAS